MKYVGIDIGDGESAVTVVSEDGAMIPSVVTLGNVKSIRSIVGDLKGTPVIGDQVVLNHTVTNRSARFKSKFLFDMDGREDLRRFAEGLYTLLKKSIHDPELKIALGCPAEWSQEARERYAAIVSSVGFPNLYTVSESRAAYLYAHYSNELNLSPEQLARPTLVIDIGSSTLDYAYIVDGRERDIGVFGEKQLGGGILDALILDYAVEQSPKCNEIRKVFATSSSWRSYCELIARQVKETYFLAEEKYVEEPCRDIAPIYANGANYIPLQIAVSGNIINSLLDKKIPELDDRSFRETLENSLNRAKSITSENPVELMILTGGASRMAFFQRMCAACFADAKHTLCPEPEFSIARGLGIAARTDDKLSQFRSKIRAYFESGAIDQEVAGNLPYLLPEYVACVIKILQNEALIKALREYRGDTSDKSKLEVYLKKATEVFLADKDMTEDADKLINAWVGAHLQHVQKRLDQICDEFHIDRADMSLVKIHGQVEVPQIKIPLIVRLLVGTERAPKLREAIYRWSYASPFLRNQMRNLLKTQLADPQGDFARALRQSIVEQLQLQIDEQTKKVEIQIN